MTPQPTLPLRPVQRLGLVIGLVALSLCLDGPNLALRLWLRDRVLGGGVPLAVDHIFLMATLKLLVWSAIGLLVLGPRRCGLGAPIRPREAWLAGAGSGVVLLLAAVGALAVQGHVVFVLRFPAGDLLGNLVSNFYEELIFRGCLLGLLVTVLGPSPRARGLAVVVQALLFCQGHRQYPLPLLTVVFLAGLVWGATTLRYRSVWPGYAGHMVVDGLGSCLVA